MPTDQLTWAGPRMSIRRPTTLEHQNPAGGDDDWQGDETLAHLLTYNALMTAARTAAALQNDPRVPSTAPLLITPGDTLEWTLAALIESGDGLSLLTLCQGVSTRRGLQLITHQVPPGRVRRLRATVPWVDPTAFKPLPAAHWRVARDGARVFVDEDRAVAPGQEVVTVGDLFRDLEPLRVQARRTPVEMTHLRVWAAAVTLLSASIYAVLREPLSTSLLLLQALFVVGWVRLPDPHRERALLARALARLHPER